MSSKSMNDHSDIEDDEFEKIFGFSVDDAETSAPQFVESSKGGSEKRQIAEPVAPLRKVTATAFCSNPAPQSAPKSPTQTSLSKWEEARAGYPVSFARSTLFRAGEGSAGEGWLLNEEIPAAKGILMKYTGPRLNQKHALVFQALVEATSGATHDLVMPHGEILKLVGVHTSTFASHEWLWRHFKELVNARIEVETDRVKYYGGLIHSITHDLRTGMLAISLDHHLAGLFANEVIRSSTIEKSDLGNSQLTLWLHSYVSSHQTPYPISALELKRLCGSDRPLKIFRFKLKKAFEELSSGPNALIKSWKIVDDKFSYEKRATSVVMLSDRHLKPQVDKVNGGQNKGSSRSIKSSQRRSALVL